jgi:hypothetical protein
MIFYLCKTQAGQRLAGTQADAKALDRKFEQVDVPTDKAGLIGFINRLYLQIGIPGPVRGIDGPFDMDDAGQPITDAPEPPKPSYIAQSIAQDDEFDALPIARQLDFAARAMANARDAL